MDTTTEPTRRKIWGVIGASAAGTVIEWYDFFIFGTLATTLAPKMYPAGNETVQLLLYLSTFAIGFIVRPFGALFFGRLGDVVGRKYTFLVTLLIMGGSTAAVGVLPGYATIGYLAPALLILFRLLQGLAVGGEYGGAAVYVAEHVPDRKRGFYTSFIQVCGSFALFFAIAVVIVTQRMMSPEAFTRWGYRLPFLLSIALVGISLYIRLKMSESPIFSALKATGKTSTNPLRDALSGRENRKRILVTLFGVIAGQAVVWYTSQFYALFFLATVLKLPPTEARVVVAAGLLIGMPLFVVFGALSDRIGRKKLMLTGCALGALSFVPLYRAMTAAAGTGVASLGEAKNAIGERTLAAFDSAGNLVAASPASDPNYALLIGLIVIQVTFAAMVYGPLAAYLVEAFPAKVRYTALSLPYHLGNGVFGGLLPLIGLYVCAATGSLYTGLIFPVVVAALTVVVGSLTLPETRHVRIWDEVENLEPSPGPASVEAA